MIDSLIDYLVVGLSFYIVIRICILRGTKTLIKG